jgi:hypothetical protein
MRRMCVLAIAALLEGTVVAEDLCGTSVGADASGMRRVEVWFIPTGGHLPSYQNPGSLPVSNLGAPNSHVKTVLDLRVGRGRASEAPPKEEVFGGFNLSSKRSLWL